MAADDITKLMILLYKFEKFSKKENKYAKELEEYKEKFRNYRENRSKQNMNKRQCDYTTLYPLYWCREIMSFIGADLILNSV